MSETITSTASLQVHTKSHIPSSLVNVRLWDSAADSVRSYWQVVQALTRLARLTARRSAAVHAVEQPGRPTSARLAVGGLVGSYHVGGQPAPVADLVAVVAGPPPDRLGVLSGRPRVAAAPATATDPPGML